MPAIHSFVPFLSGKENIGLVTKKLVTDLAKVGITPKDFSTVFVFCSEPGPLVVKCHHADRADSEEDPLESIISKSFVEVYGMPVKFESHRGEKV